MMPTTVTIRRVTRSMTGGDGKPANDHATEAEHGEDDLNGGGEAALIPVVADGVGCQGRAGESTRDVHESGGGPCRCRTLLPTNRASVIECWPPVRAPRCGW